jgi:hypothetical protein
VYVRLACVVALASACMAPLTRDADNVIDLRYRAAATTTATATATATDLYHWVGERSLSVGSHCRMVPIDSQMFAIRAERCGGLAAWYWGVARLFLEQAGSSRFTPGIRLDDRRRWMDLPGPCS